MSRQKFWRVPQQSVSGPDIVCWGDSLTAQGYPELMAGTIPNTVRNAGVGGESSTTILARQGGSPFYLQPVGGTIPASGSIQVTITSPVGQWPLLQGGGTPGSSFTGSLAGVQGTVTLTKAGAPYSHDSGDIYTFTRTTAGSAVSVGSGQPFVTNFSEARRGDIAVIWAGKNNYTQTDVVVNDIATMIDHMARVQKRYLVLGVTTSSDNTPEGIRFIEALNRQLASIYGDRFVDTLGYLEHNALAEAQIAPTAQDIQDIANGVVPSSLRQDPTHLNATGRAIIANLVGRTLYKHGWVSSFTPITFAQPTASVWVSSTGSDTNTGTQASPLKTFAAARTKVRTITNNGTAIPSGGVQVNVMTGVYPQADTFLLSAADTGSEGSPIIWKASDGPVTVSGSVTIPSNAYQTPSASMQALFPAAVRSQVKMVDLAALGIHYSAESANRGEMPTAVISDGVILTCARYPNAGWLPMEEGSNGGTTSGSGDDGSIKTVTPAVFKETDPIVLSWAGAIGNAMVVAQPVFQWSTQYAKITAIDAASQTVAIDQASWWGTPDTRLGRYYIYNLPQALDSSGEYYLDSDTGKLYLVPGTTVTVATVVGPIVQLVDLSHVRFDGINICEGTQHGVYAMNCSHIAVVNSEVRHVGTGIAYETVMESMIDNVHVHHVASTGISIAAGDKPSLTRGNDVIANCEVDHFAMRQLTYAPGVSLYGVGHTLLHSNIHDTPHEAVITWGCDHLIQDNWIHHAVNDNADAGAFYTGRDWTDRGNVLNRNLFSDIGTNDFRSNSQVSIYFDDGSSGFTATNNIIVRGSRPFHHCGRDNEISNNVIIDAQDIAYYVGNWGSNAKNQNTLTTRYNNVVNAANYNATLWGKYPHFANLLSDEPATPKYNTIANCLLAGTVSGVIVSSSPVPQVTVSGLRHYATSQLNFDVTRMTATTNSCIVTGIGSVSGIDVSKNYGCRIAGTGPAMTSGNGTTITNFAPVPDPGIGTIQGWSGYGEQPIPYTTDAFAYTIEPVTGMATVSAARCTVTSATADPVEASCGRRTNSMTVVSPGTTYTGSMQVRSLVNTLMQLRFRYYDEALSVATDSYSDYVSITAGTVATLSGLTIAPSGKRYMTVTAMTQTALAPGSYVDMTACMVVEGNV